MASPATQIIFRWRSAQRPNFLQTATFLRSLRRVTVIEAFLAERFAQQRPHSQPLQANVKLARGEDFLGMTRQAIADLVEIGFNHDRCVIEVAGDHGLLDRLRFQPAVKSLIQPIIPPASIS
jgi:hypothetical protein